MRIRKSVCFATGVAVLSALMLSGCTAPEDTTQPPTQYEWEEQNSALVEDLQITGVTVAFDESKLPQGMVKQTVSEEETISGQATQASDTNSSANYANADKTCFLGFNTYGQVLSPKDGETLTDAMVEAQTAYLKDVQLSVATISTDEGTPIEVKVMETTINDSAVFTAMRAFDLKVQTDTLTEDGEPAEGNQVLSISYSCSSNPPITADDFQKVLDAVVVSYTTDYSGE